MTAGARDTWLDQLEALHTAATGGEWREVHDDYHCPHVVTDADYVCETHDNPADAAAIVAEHNALPALLALARGVAELHRGAFGTGNPGFDNRCVADGHDWPCPTIRLLAVAAPDEEAR